MVGSLANSYATYQLRLSARLAREHHALRWAGRASGVRKQAGRHAMRSIGAFYSSQHLLYPLHASACAFAPMPARSDAVAIEVLSRQLAAQGGGPDALLSLCPWLEYLTIPTQVRLLMFSVLHCLLLDSPPVGMQHN